MPGEVLGLIGPNGSGKTTFFNVVTGIYPADAGRALLEGADSPGAGRRRSTGPASRAPSSARRLCLPLSIFDNIMIGNHAHLNAGLGFNLLRRRAFRRELEASYAAARELVALFDPPLAERMLEPRSA